MDQDLWYVGTPASNGLPSFTIVADFEPGLAPSQGSSPDSFELLCCSTPGDSSGGEGQVSIPVCGARPCTLRLGGEAGESGTGVMDVALLGGAEYTPLVPQNMQIPLVGEQSFLMERDEVKEIVEGCQLEAVEFQVYRKYASNDFILYATVSEPSFQNTFEDSIPQWPYLFKVRAVDAAAARVLAAGDTEAGTKPVAVPGWILPEEDPSKLAGERDASPRDEDR